jgi:hypothetical protein
VGALGKPAFFHMQMLNEPHWLGDAVSFPATPLVSTGTGVVLVSSVPSWGDWVTAWAWTPFVDANAAPVAVVSIVRVAATIASTLRVFFTFGFRPFVLGDSFQD